MTKTELIAAIAAGAGISKAAAKKALDTTTATIAGAVKKGDKVTIVKEPDNQYDKEAILVKVEGLGAIGHVANSVHTVLGESYSAGRIYDRFKKKAKGKVVVVTPKGALCELKIEK